MVEKKNNFRNLLPELVFLNVDIIIDCHHHNMSFQIFSGVQWSCGRASCFRSKGLGFKTTSAISKLGQLRSPHFACVKAVGSFNLVSMLGVVKDPTQGNGKKPVVVSELVISFSKLPLA